MSSRLLGPKLVYLCFHLFSIHLLPAFLCKKKTTTTNLLNLASFAFSSSHSKFFDEHYIFEVHFVDRLIVYECCVYMGVCIVLLSIATRKSLVYATGVEVMREVPQAERFQ